MKVNISATVDLAAANKLERIPGRKKSEYLNELIINDVELIEQYDDAAKAEEKIKTDNGASASSF